ncbi:MAG TPA: GNAT family N-acetyltransferase [bacterium]|nr:GNAT family N-acetyltransferase [bacterium]
MIRPLSAAEIPALAALLAQLPLMVRYKRTVDALRADLESALARGDGLLVWDDGKGAQALCWYFPSGTLGLGGYLRLIAVAPGATSHGLGTKLLEAFEAATGAKSRHAFLLCSSFNTEAQRFYERHGYRKVGSLPALVLPDVDEHIYWKRLP